MTNNEAKKSLRKSDLSSDEQTVPDPWQASSPVQKTHTAPETWHFPTETFPLIASSGNPEAPKISSHQSTSEEILLEDELKLKNSAGSLLKQKLEKAFALLYWWKNRTAKS